MTNSHSTPSMQKAIALVRLLDAETLARLLPLLSKSDYLYLTEAVSQSYPLHSKDLIAAAQDSLKQFSGHHTAAPEEIDAISRLLSEKLSPIDRERLIASLQHESSPALLQILSQANSVELTNYLNEQPAEIVAALLLPLSVERMAVLFNRFSASHQQVLFYHLVHLSLLPDEQIEIVSSMMAPYLASEPDTLFLTLKNSYQKAADLLTLLSDSTQKTLLYALAQHHPLLHSQVRNLLFLKEHLLLLGDSALELLCQVCNPTDLLISLAPLPIEQQKSILRFLTAEQLQIAEEKVSSIPPLSPFTIQSSQHQVAIQLEQLQQEGKIDLKSSSEHSVH